MTDDYSAIPETGCNVLSNPTTIYNYYNGVRKTYLQVGGKWIYSAQNTYTGNTSNYVCVDISNLNSFSYFEPIYQFISFCLVALVIYLFFKLIRGFLYAFSR